MNFQACGLHQHFGPSSYPSINAWEEDRPWIPQIDAFKPIISGQP